MYALTGQPQSDPSHFPLCLAGAGGAALDCETVNLSRPNSYTPICISDAHCLAGVGGAARRHAAGLFAALPSGDVRCWGPRSVHSGVLQFSSLVCACGDACPL